VTSDRELHEIAGEPSGRDDRRGDATTAPRGYEKHRYDYQGQEERPDDGDPEPVLFSAAMDVEPSREGLFNEVYDNEHVPLLLAVPGVISVARFKREELTMIIGGERRTIVVDAEPRLQRTL